MAGLDFLGCGFDSRWGDHVEGAEFVVGAVETPGVSWRAVFVEWERGERGAGWWCHDGCGRIVDGFGVFTCRVRLQECLEILVPSKYWLFLVDVTVN